MMKKIRLGQVGVTHDHAPGHIACVKRFPEVFEIVGIAVRGEWEREEVRCNETYAGIPVMTEEQLLNAGCDAVMIETYELDLIATARRFADAGIPVHIDKPGGEDLGEFAALLSTAKRKGIPLQMAYMYRYNPAIRDMLGMVRRGELGEIGAVNAVMNCSHVPDKRAWLGGFRGGMMFFLGCHMVDLVMQVLGEPKSVTPFLTVTGFDGVGAIDASTAVFTYDHAVGIAQSNACEFNGYSRRHLIVNGSLGTYAIQPLESPTTTFYTSREAAKTWADHSVSRPVRVLRDEERYDDMMLDFAAMVRGEKENPVSLEYELMLQKNILLACGFREEELPKVSL